MARTADYARLERRRARPSPLMIALALAGVAAIVFVTVCPIALRPHVANANLERFGAYVLLGGLIARARGRAWVSAAALVVVLAFALEAAQALAPERHAVAADAMVKAVGGLAGVAAREGLFALRRLIRRQRARRAIALNPSAA